MNTLNLTHINGLSVKEVKQAIALGEANLKAVTPEFQPELIARLHALRDRMRRLERTERAIQKTNKALRSGGVR